MVFQEQIRHLSQICCCGASSVEELVAVNRPKIRMKLFYKNRGTNEVPRAKVKSVVPMAIVSKLPHAGFGPNHLVEMTIGKTHPTIASENPF